MKTKWQKYLFVVCLAISSLLRNSLAQISPPGLGRANTANWLALGIRQELDTIDGKGWQSMSYMGMGRKSNLNNYNPVYLPALFVLNQEFYHQFHTHWQYSLALSYRKQYEYIDKILYESNNLSIQHEIRLYTRFSYLFKTSRFKFVPTFRQEFRKFFYSTFGNVNEDIQFRSRVRLQLTVNLNDKKVHRLIVSSEQLFSISKETTPDLWTSYQYQESRFSLYYSFSPEALPLIFNVGYINNLVGGKALFDVHYLAFDIIIKDPFKARRRVNQSIYEHLE